MEASEETSSVADELMEHNTEGEKPVTPINVMEESDNSVRSTSSNANAVATAALSLSALPHAGASRSTLRVRPPPAFLLKVYDIVNNPDTDSIISWNSSGNTFIVWDPHRLAAQVLGHFFRHNNFSSFVCQLNTYGFKKINWERLEFRNEWFQKGKRRWLNRIKRRNQSAGNMQPLRVVQPPGAFTLSEKQRKLETLLQEHEAWKTEMMELIRKRERLEQEMDSLEKRAEGSAYKRQKILKYMLQEILKMDESDAKNACSSVDLGAATHEEEERTIAAENALLEKQHTDGLNLEKLSEEERAKLQPDIVIGLEDLMDEPADWTEWARDVEDKARNLLSNY